MKQNKNWYCSQYAPPVTVYSWEGCFVSKGSRNELQLAARYEPQPIQIIKKEDSRPFLRIGYLLLRMFVLHQKHREWTFRTISPTEAYFPGISPKISMAEKTFDTILLHSAKPLLTASHQSVLAFQFQPAVLGDSIP